MGVKRSAVDHAGLLFCFVLFGYPDHRPGMFCSSGAAQLGTVRRFYLEAEASGSYYQPLAKEPRILAANFVNGVNLRDRPVLLDHLELLSGD